MSFNSLSDNQIVSATLLKNLSLTELAQFNALLNAGCDVHIFSAIEVIVICLFSIIFFIYSPI
jgi:hypothetical protein